MTYHLRFYTSLVPRGETVEILARCNTEAATLAHTEFRRRVHEIKQRAQKAWAWTLTEKKQRKRFVLGELANLHVDVGRV